MEYKMKVLFGPLVTSVFLSACAATEFTCPQDWVMQGPYCFGVLHSPDLIGFRSVYDARKTCNVHGGDIASLVDRDAYHTVFDLLQEVPSGVRPAQVYIGLNDIVDEGNYLWVDGSATSYDMWGPGEPNNVFKKNEDCVLLESANSRWFDDGTAVWKDYHCCRQSGIYAVVCEKSINSTEDMIQIDDDENVFARACFSELNECASNPCRYHGKCHDAFLDYKCECPPGLTGKNCEEDLHCQPIQSWKDFNISSKDTLYQTVINITCSLEYFTFPDGKLSVTSKCNSSGQWEPAPQDCTLPEKEHKPIRKRYTKPTEAKGATAVGMVAIIFVVTEASFLVFLDLDYFIAHLMPLFAFVRNKLRRKDTTDNIRDQSKGKELNLTAIPGTSQRVAEEEDMENGTIDSK